jgi:lipopolysaccharide exporter
MSSSCVTQGRSLRPGAKRSLWALLLRFLGLVVGLGTVAVISRSLGVEGFGLFSLGLTVLGAVGQLADSGMVQAVSAEVSKDPTRKREFGTSAVVARLVLATFAAAVIMVAATFWLAGDDASVVCLFAACAPLGSLTALTGITNAEIRPQVAAWLTLLQGVMWLAVALVVASWSPSPAHYAAGYLLLSFVQAGVTASYFWRRDLLGRPSLQAQRTIIVRAAPAAVLGLVVTAYYRLDTVLLYALAGDRDTGLYAAAYRFLDVAQILPALLVVPLLPILAGTTIEPARRQELALGISRLALCLGVVVSLALSAGAPLLVELIYGPEYRGAVWPLRLLGIAYIGVVMGYVGTTAVFALGKTWTQLPRVAVIGVASIAVQVPAIDRYGAMGAASVTALTEVVIAGNGLWLVRKDIGLRLRELRIPTALAVAAAGVVVQLVFPNPLYSILATVVLVCALLPLRLLRREDLGMAIRRSA